MAHVDPKFGLGIDFETSGYSLPDYCTRHQGISFGAIIFELKTLDVVETLYREIKFDPKYEWNAYAESIHGLSQAHLAANGVAQETAAADLANMVIKWIGTESVVLLGHRVNFDRAFTNQLTESIGINFDFHPTFFDSSSLATILLETSKSDEIFSMLGLPARGKHNALEDILHTIASIRMMKEYFITGLATTLQNS